LDIEQGKKLEARSKQVGKEQEGKAQKFSMTYNEKEHKSKAKTVLS